MISFTFIDGSFFIKIKRKIVLIKLATVNARAIPFPFNGHAKIKTKIIFDIKQIIPASVGSFVFPCA